MNVKCCTMLHNDKCISLICHCANEYFIFNGFFYIDGKKPIIYYFSKYFRLKILIRLNIFDVLKNFLIGTYF